MAYIGRDTDKLSNIEVLDTITFDGSSSYTLQKNSVNFTPSSANNVLVSIDGVVQANNFTTSGSTIDFGVAVPSTSTCDWIYHIGVGLITTPADGTVSLAKLSATGTKDATTFLRGDNTFSTISAGITEADEWRLTTSFTGDQAPISSNLERKDSADFSVLGTGMTESSGIFTFPSTGYWFVMFKMHISGGSIDNCTANIVTTTDNFSTTIGASSGTANPGNGGQGQNDTAQAFALIDVTDTSNVKVRFDTSSVLAANTVGGDTNESKTSMIFIRLGDT